MAVHKEIVEISAHFDLTGKMTPERVYWQDGRIYEIDKITDVRRAASLKAGGVGIRYTCRIHGKETYVWYDDVDGVWFVEGKE